MNIFGIGLPELVIILVIALLVMGPERMLNAARDGGRILGRLRREMNSINLERLIEEPEKKPGPPAAPPTAGTPPTAPSVTPGAEGASMPSAAGQDQPPDAVTWAPAQPPSTQPVRPEPAPRPSSEREEPHA